MRAKMSQGANVDKETGVNVKLRRTGPVRPQRYPTRTALLLMRCLRVLPRSTCRDRFDPPVGAPARGSCVPILKGSCSVFAHYQGLEKMRRFHRTLRDLLAAEFGEGDRGMKACFTKIDADGSGLVRRAELRNFLKKYSRSTPDNVISGLIDYVDTDGDAKTLSLSEFLKMMQSDFLE